MGPFDHHSKSEWEFMSTPVKNSMGQGCISKLRQPLIGLGKFDVSSSNNRAQRALGRSPEEKVKGHSGANNREPQGHNLNNFSRGPLDDAIYQI